MRKRFEELISQLKAGLYEKDTEVGLSLLSAVAGESVLLLGPPGIAKSMIARRLKCAFSGGKSFEYLMNRFSTPDEIFGPISISRLKNDDVYERNTAGFMPDADIVFLDEIWKAGPAILNTLLTIINERVFRNGRCEIKVPLKLLIGASNELPANGEGLEALWDRFLIRIECGCVKNEDNFYRILQESVSDNVNIPEELAITAQEYSEWRSRIAAIPIGPEVLKAITYIRSNLKKPGKKIYVSDRRWQHVANLLKASAFMHDRASVGILDLPVVSYCLWDETDDIALVTEIVQNAMFHPYELKVKQLMRSIASESKKLELLEAVRRAQDEDDHADDNKQLYDGYNYHIDNFGTGVTSIFYTDYKNLPRYSPRTSPADGVIYSDPQNPKNQIIRIAAGLYENMMSNGVSSQKIKLYRDDDHILLNGVRYKIHQLPFGATQQLTLPIVDACDCSVLEDSAEMIARELTDLYDCICNGNMLLSIDDTSHLQKQIKALKHEIALARIEIQKLQYGD